MYTTQRCTITSSDYYQSQSTAGNIIFTDRTFTVMSTDCPEIQFSKEPDDVKSFAEMKNNLIPGQRYEFRVGRFHLFESYRKGVGVNW